MFRAILELLLTIAVIAIARVVFMGLMKGISSASSQAFQNVIRPAPPALRSRPPPASCIKTPSVAPLSLKPPVSAVKPGATPIFTVPRPASKSTLTAAPLTYSHLSIE